MTTLAPEEEVNRSTTPVNHARLYAEEVEWLWLEVLSIFFAAVTIYLLVMSIIYEVRTRQRASRRRQNIAYSEKFLPVTLIAAIVLTIAAFLSIQVPMLVRYEDGRIVCNVYRIAATWFYNLGLAAVFLLLWLRIRVFYSHKIMRSLQSRMVITLNYVILFVVVVAALQQGGIFTFISDARYTKNIMCAYSYVGKEVLPSIVFLTISSAVCVVTLGGLLVYPMWRHRDILSNRSAQSVRSMSRRVIVTTLLCISTYILAPLVVTMLRHRNIVMGYFIYSIMLLANIIIVICSFTNWKSRIFPICKPPADDAREHSSGRTSSGKQERSDTVITTVTNAGQDNETYVTEF
ncbi:uncharacterized protein LOC144749660 [Ciona intestinalis]